MKSFQRACYLWGAIGWASWPKGGDVPVWVSIIGAMGCLACLYFYEDSK